MSAASQMSIKPLQELKEVLAHDRVVQLLEDDIYSVLPDASRSHHYDRRATVYDWLVVAACTTRSCGAALRAIMLHFARQAIRSSNHGKFLDA